ncbi:MAG: hypothetical protein NTY37_12390 [Methanothrix sp.]|nr:hypothetical protein [Methanothrix sp.]
MSEESTRIAQFWEKLDGDVECSLCHQQCRIRPGKRGICGVRENQEGKLMTLVYGSLVAANIDPIEKKPFFHFLPRQPGLFHSHSRLQLPLSALPERGYLPASQGDGTNTRRVRFAG